MFSSVPVSMITLQGEEGSHAYYGGRNTRLREKHFSQWLEAMGYSAFSFAQEHSASPRVWRRRNPDVLIALYCSYDTLVQRRGIQWPKRVWLRQLYSLGDAWAHADIRMQTDMLTPDELIARVAER